MEVAIYPDILESCSKDPRMFADILAPFMGTTGIARLAIDTSRQVLNSYNGMIDACADCKYTTLVVGFMFWLANNTGELYLVDLEGQFNDVESLFCELASKLHPNHYLGVGDVPKLYSKANDIIGQKNVHVLDVKELRTIITPRGFNISTSGDHSPIVIGDNNEVG